MKKHKEKFTPVTADRGFCHEEEKKEEVVKQRYYHLYKKGELEADVEVAGGKVVESGYSKDNWYSIITK